MVGGMGRGEAGTAGTVFYQETDMIGQRRIAAGPQMKNMLFDHRAAHEIAQGNVQYEEQGPPAPVSLKVDGNEQYQEKIKWCPKNTFAHEREKRIEERVVPLPVDPVKQGAVKTF